MTEPSTHTLQMPWRAWFGDDLLTLDFPPGWRVDVCLPADAEDIGDDEIERSFASPIGIGRIRDQACAAASACIVIDDLSRPTPSHRVLPYILRELDAAGIDSDEILILAGVANHRPMMREDFVKKCGEDVVDHYRTRNHFSWHGCQYVGTTSHGTKVSLNADFLASQFKILVGSIVPHSVAGFGGGAKLVLPGVASIETATQFHGPTGPAVGIGNISAARLDAEEAARLAGVDCIVNVIPNSSRGIGSLVVGDVVQAHRIGIHRAKQIFATQLPVVSDICILSAYPKDNEFLQYENALAIWNTAETPLVDQEGTVVIVVAASEGPGFHSLAGEGMPLEDLADPSALVGGRDVLFLSPGVVYRDRPPASSKVTLARSWPEARRLLETKHGPEAAVSVFPCAAIQIAGSTAGREIETTTAE